MGFKPLALSDSSWELPVLQKKAPQNHTLGTRQLFEGFIFFTETFIAIQLSQFSLI